MAITMNATQQGAFRLLLTAIGVSAVGSRITRTALPMAALLLLGATLGNCAYARYLYPSSC